MAPRRGGGHGGSGGISCQYCSKTLILSGDYWENPTTNALFAFRIITMIVLLVCMFLARRFKWVREKGTDSLRHSGYVTAAFCTFASIVIAIVVTALSESYYSLTYSFYIIYIFQDFFFRVGEVLITAIIARTIAEDLGPLTAQITTANGFIIGLFWISAMVAFGFTTAYFSVLLSVGDITLTVSEGVVYSNIAYEACALTIALYLTFLAVMAVLKRNSKGGSLMLRIVIPSLVLHHLIGLIMQSVTNFQRITQATATLSSANAFVSVFTTISIYLVVALIGGLRQHHSGTSILQEPKLAETGPHDAAVGPYAAPLAPYGTHESVGQYPAPGQQQQQSTPQQHGIGTPYATQGQQYGATDQQIQYAPPQGQGQYTPVQPVQQGQYGYPDSSSGARLSVSPAQYAAPAQH